MHKFFFCDKDHPRSRGEYPVSSSHDQRRTGSSPLSRGIQSCSINSNTVTGIIPALAGNTNLSDLKELRRRDHPRSRGEYTPFSHCTTASQGSSPLSRGIPALWDPQDPRPRIIPALAGNTGGYGGRKRGARDHPRSRGEYLLMTSRTGPGRGSSPLSRGILPHLRMRVHAIRIIPALAGNTGCTEEQGELLKDHPRSRGEYYKTLRTLRHE